LKIYLIFFFYFNLTFHYFFVLAFRSPAAYTFLREQNILPLPCPRTVRRYLSLIKSPCGFDQQFFQLFKKKISMLSEKQKHGVLAFDEIMLRESLGVNSNTLTYTGLENLGKDLSSDQAGIDMKANHGLVFVFQSLGANFCQPIGVFAAKRSVKGIYIF